MKLKRERKKIVSFGKKLVDSGLTRGTGGNLSIYNRSQNLLAISPSGIPYNEVKLKDIVVMNLNNQIIAGNKKPSSEYKLHRVFYKNRNDISAVVHCHSVYAATLSILREKIAAAHYLIALAGKDVRCAEYAAYGSQKLADNAFQAMKDRYAVLLANHGLLTGADSIENAFKIAEELEYVAETYYRARSIGKPVILSDQEIEVIQKKFQKYGQEK